MKRLIAACAISMAFLTAPVSLQAADTYTETKHPIVLVHGLLGFDSVGGIEYFYGIPSQLRRSGATVHIASVSQANTSELRGEQLLQELQTLKARHGYTKFNLIGHSHGGTTIRYVAGVSPDIVASVSTIGTPHHGSKVADALAGISNAGLKGFLADLVNGLATVIAYISGSPSNPQNSLGALQSLSTAGSLDFNRRFPDGAPTTHCGSGEQTVKGVRYYSMGGTSQLTNPFDISDYLMLANSVFFGSEKHDGLVSKCSSHWGRVLRDDYGWNHFDQANQVFGLRGWFSSDPIAVYRAHANRLKTAGL